MNYHGDAIRDALVPKVGSVLGIPVRYGFVRVEQSVPVANVRLESFEAVADSAELGLKQVRQVYNYQITWARAIVENVNPAITAEADVKGLISAFSDIIFADIAQEYLCDSFTMDQMPELTEPVFVAQLTIKFVVWETEHGY